MPAPVRVTHQLQRSAQSVYIKAIQLPCAHATRQLHIKDDDPATPSLELLTRKELFLANSDRVQTRITFELQVINYLINYIPIGLGLRHLLR